MRLFKWGLAVYLSVVTFVGASAPGQPEGKSQDEKAHATACEGEADVLLVRLPPRSNFQVQRLELLFQILCVCDARNWRSGRQLQLSQALVSAIAACG